MECDADKEDSQPNWEFRRKIMATRRPIEYKINREPSEYKISKHRNFVNFMDVNDDGFIDSEDFNTVSSNMARLARAGETETEEIRKAWMSCWTVMCRDTGERSRMTKEEALQGTVNFHATATQQELIQYNLEFYSATFDAIDRNKDGVISREELEIFYKAHGITDEAFISDVFGKFDSSQKGSITREEFINVMTAFWCSDDPENGCEFVYSCSKHCK